MGPKKRSRPRKPAPRRHRAGRAPSKKAARRPAPKLRKAPARSVGVAPGPRPARRPGGQWEPVVLGPRGHPSVVRPLRDEALRGGRYEYGFLVRERPEPPQDEGGENTSG
jgi:hypothetical protein